MPDQTSIFESNQNPATQPNQNGGNTNAQDSNDLAHLLVSIKNERGEQKYKSVEDALVGLRNAQEYIPTLTSQLSQKDMELKAAREEAARVAELERTIEALTSQNNGQPQTTATPSISEDQIAELVNRTLTRKQQEDAAKANITSVVQTLQNQFGADAEKTYNEKATELGMTVAELNALAARNPKAVFKILGVSQEAPKPQSSSSSVSFNTDGFQPPQTSFIGRNTKTTLIGATTTDLNEETQRAKQMVDELHKQGKSISDLTNPKTYFKVFR